MRAASAMAVLALVVAGCGASVVQSAPFSDLTTLTIPRPVFSVASDGWKPGRPGMQAVLRGQFYAKRTVDGACAWLGSPDDELPVLWPAEYSVRFSPTELLGPNGLVVAREGDQMQVGGGWQPSQLGAVCSPSGTDTFYVQSVPVHIPTTSTASGSWTKDQFQGDGLVVGVSHPGEWTRQLAPLSIHYATTLGYLANFPLREPCDSSYGELTCKWSREGSYPPGGIMVTVGTGGYGPGPIDRETLFARGIPTTVDHRRASETDGDGRYCGGTGADHSISYVIDDGRSQGVLDISFCWRGSSSPLTDVVHAVVGNITIGPDPSNSGPFPT